MTKNEIIKSCRYFERKYSTFWAPVSAKKNKFDMADEIRIRFMRAAGILASVYGEDTAGYWSRQFALLADDVERSKDKKEKIGDKTSAECIAVFRALASEGKPYTRPPEDQSYIFNSEKWRVNHA